MSFARFRRAGAAVAISLALGFATQTGVAAARDGSDWPALGGADGTGVSDETGLPVRWSADSNVAWTTPIVGRGHSSPIILGDRVYLTTAVKGVEEPGHTAVEHRINGQLFVHPDSTDAGYRHEYRVLALDADSGAVVWDRLAHEGLPYDNRHRASSYASPTPATDGELIFAYFGTPGLFAFDRQGELVWRAEIGRIGTLGMGVGSSPLVYGDTVIVQADEEFGESSFIIALDRSTGEPVWKTPRQVQVSWTTPTLVQSAAGDRLVTAGNEWIVAYDPTTGEEVWRMEGLQSNAIHRPLVHGDLAIFTAGYPQRVIKSVRLGGHGDVTESDRLAWAYNKGTAYVPSNLVYEGRLYLITDNGVISCLDAETGELIYEGGRMPVAQRFYASPVAYDGKFLLSGADGEMFVIKAGDEFEVLSTNSIGEPIFATPAIANGRIYVRTAQHVWAIGGVG